MVQMLSDPAPLLGRTIAYERLIASKLIREDERAPRLRPQQSSAPAAAHAY